MGILAPAEQPPVQSNDGETKDPMTTLALSIHPLRQSLNTVLQVQATRLTTQTIAFTPIVQEIPGIDSSETTPRLDGSSAVITSPSFHTRTTPPLAQIAQTNEEVEAGQLELPKGRRTNAYSPVQGVKEGVEIEDLEELGCGGDGDRGNITAKVDCLPDRREHEGSEEIEREGNEEISITGIQGSQVLTGNNSVANIPKISDDTSNIKTKILAKPRASRKRRISTVDTDATDTVEAGPSSALRKKPRALRKTRKPTVATTRAATPEGSTATTTGDSTAIPIKSRKRTREATPPNSEELQILPGVVKMADLCRDIKIGKKSKRFTELEKLDWTEVVRKQRVTKAQVQATRAAGVDIPPPESAEERIERLAAEISATRPLAPQQRHAMQVRVVNGQIVLDEETLQIDRRELAQEDGPREIVEENSLTRRVNAGTWGKREKPERWDTESTEKFYEGLGMFGTDFELISGLFPDRSRRQIKNKFNAEERRNPARVTNALRKRVVVGTL